MLLFLAIVTPFINPLLRLPSRQKDSATEANEAKSRKISIVIAAHNNAIQLNKSLELFLNQDYPADYEVIVVADESDAETEDVVKLYSSNPRLYSTFMPLTSRYLSRKKLAVTLGVKAAHYDWVIITDGYCIPSGDQWLKAFASAIDDDKELVLGHSVFDEEASALYQFEHLHHSLYSLKSADNGHAVSIDSPLLAIRKDVFMKGNGFRGNLQFARGEYAFLVNKYCNEGNNTLSIAPEAIIIEETPLKRRWVNKHLYHLNTYRQLHGFWHLSLLYQLDMWAMHICNLVILASITYGVLLATGTLEGIIPTPKSTDEGWIIVGTSCLAFIIEYVIRIIIGNRAIKQFGLSISPVLIPLFEFTQTFRNNIYRLRYMMANKNDFITHKL